MKRINMELQLTPAARALGRRMRLGYLTVLIMLAGVLLATGLRFRERLGDDAQFAAMIDAAARQRYLGAQTVQLATLALLDASPQAEAAVKSKLREWTLQQATIDGYLPVRCEPRPQLCTDFGALKRQQRLLASLVASSTASMGVGGERALAFAQAHELDSALHDYLTRADRWMEEFARDLAGETLEQQRRVWLWSLLMILSAAAIVTAVLEPIIRRLQAERSAFDGADEALASAHRRLGDSHARLEREKTRAEITVALLESHKQALDEHVIVSTTTPEGKFTYVNQKFCDVSGYAREELIGQHFGIIKSGVHSDEMYDNMRRCRTNGQVWRGELCNRAKCGRLYWVYTTIVPFKDSQGRVIEFIVMRTDITERKLAEERVSQQKALLDATSRLAGVGGWEYDPASHRLMCSETICRIHELPPGEELTLDRVIASHPPGARERVAEGMRDALAQGTRFDIEVPMITFTGNQRWVRVVCEPQMQDGHCLRLIGALQDVTAARESAEKLRIAAQAAGAANVAKGEFLANMSHELRTPLNGVLGMAGLLLDSGLDPEQREHAEIVRSSGAVLLALVNNILDLSKLEAGEVALEKADFELRAIVDETVDAVAVDAGTKGLELLVDIDPACPATLNGDAGRLRQILVNLLSNAVKFTDSGQVIVAVTPAPGKPGRLGLAFSVQDTGVGLSREQSASVFTPFTQADGSTTRRHGGSGLGLSICRRLVEAMDGAIGVDSVPGSGSTFWFQVMLDSAAEERSAPAPRLARGARALVIDANPVSLRILANHLRGWGLEVWTADGVADGLEQFGELAASGDGPQLAVVDGRLPGPDGRWLGAEIRRRDPAARCRLLKLNPLGHDADVETARLASAISKPVKRDALYRAIAGLLDPVSPGPGRAAPAGGLNGLNALLVDDNPVNQKLALRLLTQLGMRVTQAWNGAEALESLRERPFDVVLMDCQMPVLDGYRGHPAAAPAGQRRARPPRSGDCADRARHERRPGALPRRGHGRLPEQTHQTERVAGDPAQGAARQGAASRWSGRRKPPRGR